MNFGDLLFDAKFQFPNGHIDYKLIIVVCKYGENCLVLQTTRQPKGKNRINGCQVGDKPPNFYVPQSTTWFDEDTWVLLNEVFEYDSNQFLYKKEDGVVQLKTNLSTLFMKDLLECLLKSRDIDGFDKDFIQRAYKELEVF
jgi:hypothetical protein